MLTALLRLHADAENAERTIGFHRDRLRQLTGPDGQIDAIAARHFLDGAQRLAVAVTARDAPITAATAVLDSLRRRTPTTSADASPPALSADMLHTR